MQLRQMMQFQSNTSKALALTSRCEEPARLGHAVSIEHFTRSMGSVRADKYGVRSLGVSHIIRWSASIGSCGPNGTCVQRNLER